MANWIQLKSLPAGIFTNLAGAVVPNRQANVYLRATTTQVAVKPNSDGSGVTLTQPVASGSDGGLPGYVASGQDIDVYDVLTTSRMQSVAWAAGDKGQPGGFADLDGGSLLPSGRVPSIVDSMLGTANNNPRLWQPGDLKTSAVPTPQSGWLLCDGSAVSRATYAALWTALGTTSSPFGQGDGSTTFNLPDFRGRVALGAGTGTAAGAVAHALGEKPTTGRGGEETHALSNGEMPVHGHGGGTGASTSGNDSPDHAHNDVGHSHNFYALLVANANTTGDAGAANVSLGGGGYRWQQYTGSSNAQISGATVRHAHSIPSLSISNDGGGAAHHQMKPHSAVNFFIKI